MNLSGAFTALITPFGDDGAIDEDALRALVDQQITEGIAGLVPAGTTGESPTLTHEENVAVVRMVVEQAAGRVPVIAGTGSNATAEAVEMTRRARELGADATLQVCPYYNRPNQEGLYAHFATVARDGGLPVVVYNIPGRTGRNIETDTLMRLAAEPGIVAVKEASGSPAQIMDVIRRRPDGFSVLSGDDNLTFFTMTHGGDGVISVAANLLPAQMQALCDAVLGNQLREARELHTQLEPLFVALLSLDSNPIPVKTAMAALGRCGPTFRLPLLPGSPELRSIMLGILGDLGITPE